MNTHDDFKRVIQEERDTLNRLADFWNSQEKCNPSISKDDQGRIRAAVGKTRLLLAKKFKQFEGLVEQSENKTSEKDISINDLQGFWDLVLIQVNEIKDIFKSLGPYEKSTSDFKKSKPKSPETDRREVKARSSSRKKLSIDSSENTEKKTKDSTQQNRSEAGDLKAKL